VLLAERSPEVAKEHGHQQPPAPPDGERDVPAAPADQRDVGSAIAYSRLRHGRQLTGRRPPRSHHPRYKHWRTPTYRGSTCPVLVALARVLEGHSESRPGTQGLPSCSSSLGHR